MSHAEHADVVVIGGGPAGLASAIEAARRGFDVAVFEPHASPIDKACGEGLMPSARALLSELGIHVDGMLFRGIRYVDALDPKCAAEGTFPFGQGIGVRRTLLHQAMHARAHALGVRFIEERIDHVREEKHHIFAGRTRAHWVIAADGLHSTLRTNLGLTLPPRHPPRFGVRRHFEITPSSAHVEVHFAEGCEAYVTPVNEHTIGVAFLYSPPARFDVLSRRFPHLHERLALAPVQSKARGAGPFEQRVRTRTVGRILLVGDAAGYLDPLTGEGVALGIAAARAAIDAIARGAPHRYERDWQRLTRAHFALTRMLLDVSRNRRTQKAMIHTLARVPWLFDQALGILGGSCPES